MTREERADRAAKMLADTSHEQGCSLLMDEWDQSFFTANELRDMECTCDREVRAMLAFADAEAAAMRERAADYLEGYAGGHHMAKSCAAAIRAFPVTGEE